MILTWGSGELDYVGLQALVRAWSSGGGSIPAPATARGNIDFDQIRVSARTGNGDQFLTYSFPAPGVSSATGTPGQIAYDASGNFYFCYGTNQWARIGPDGYSNSF